MSAATEVVKQMTPLPCRSMIGMACFATSTGPEQIDVHHGVEVIERQIGDLLVPQQAGVGRERNPAGRTAHTARSTAALTSDSLLTSPK